MCMRGMGEHSGEGEVCVCVYVWGEVLGWVWRKGKWHRANQRRITRGRGGEGVKGGRGRPTKRGWGFEESVMRSGKLGKGKGDEVGKGDDKVWRDHGH